MSMLRHIPFLRKVLLYSLTAFGGPQGHLSMMLRIFVKDRRDITEEELMEYTAFCQMLPGPSSSQTIMLIGYKRGGALLALACLGIWMLPAVSIMIGIAIIFSHLSGHEGLTQVIQYLQPMSIGFIVYASLALFKISIRSKAAFGIMLGSALATLLIPSPWIFPSVLIAAGIVSNLSRKRIERPTFTTKPIRWVNLWAFALIFVLLGTFSEMARQGNWKQKQLINLSENFYRFGSTVFGGGQALMPMMIYQFDKLPTQRGESPTVAGSDIVNGYAFVQALPGPVFSVSAYVGTMAGAPKGIIYQILIGALCTLAIFLPSTLLLLFLFPVYQRLKQQVVVLRALEGINGAIVGFVIASGIIMYRAIAAGLPAWENFGVIALTFGLLQYTKLPAPAIVALWLGVGGVVYWVA